MKSRARVRLWPVRGESAPIRPVPMMPIFSGFASAATAACIETPRTVAIMSKAESSLTPLLNRVAVCMANALAGLRAPGDRLQADAIDVAPIGRATRWYHQGPVQELLRNRRMKRYAFAALTFAPLLVFWGANAGAQSANAFGTPTAERPQPATAIDAVAGSRAQGSGAGTFGGLARHGMVATSDALAAQAGLEILRQGGNAIDAAVATGAVLDVTSQNDTGIAGISLHSCISRGTSNCMH